MFVVQLQKRSGEGVNIGLVMPLVGQDQTLEWMHILMYVVLA